MSDLISRQDAIDEANAWLLDCLKVRKQDRSCGLIRRLEDLPSAQKTGKWLTPKEYCQHLYETTGERYLPAPTGLESFVYCSQCGETSWFSNKYCPHCGSRNRGEEK